MDDYLCIENFRTIKKGDIVKVHIYIDTDMIVPFIQIIKNKVVHCTNEFILAMHFEKGG